MWEVGDKADSTIYLFVQTKLFSSIWLSCCCSCRHYAIPLWNGRRPSFFDISFMLLLIPQILFHLHSSTTTTIWSNQSWESASENPPSVLMLPLPIFLVSPFFLSSINWTNSYWFLVSFYIMGMLWLFLKPIIDLHNWFFKQHTYTWIQ